VPARVPKKKTVVKKEQPVKAFASAATLEQWLAKNHSTSQGIWIRFAKKNSGKRSVTYPEALELALIHGWIDGLRKRESDTTFLQKFTPRARRSVWSNINREKAKALIASGRMAARGLAEVERAKKDGRWDAAYDSPKNAKMSPELEKALAENPAAAKFFATLSSSNRYAILWRLQTAKKPETRAKRLDLFMRMLEKGETFH
jgi:uncharacterized protein YdeI (YjbR/CyaY-like superfamily)